MSLHRGAIFRHYGAAIVGNKRGRIISKRYHHRPRARRQAKVLAFSLVLLLIAMAGAGLCVFALKAS